ncbi:MAG: hypothetical protein ACLTDR_04785 [Adlercreutzia equolifaciens]
MPRPVLIALFSLMSPGFLSPFYSRRMARVKRLFLSGGAVMLVAGVVLAHRMLDAGGRRS